MGEYQEQPELIASIIGGNIVPLSADYVPITFSDHQAHSVKILFPEGMSTPYSPKSRPLFQVMEEVIKDQVLQ